MGVNTYDFLQATREKRVVDHKRVLNEVSKSTYFCLSRMFKSAEKKFKGGKSLKDFVLGSATSSGGFYNPHETFSIQNQDGLFPIDVPWAYHHRAYATVDEEIELNAGDAAAFVDMLMKQESGCVVDAANDWEEALWALPNKERMEDSATEQSAQKPYSVLSLVTRDGLAPSSSNGGLASGSSAWTTVQGINPSTNTFWQNANGTYSAADPTSLEDGIIPAFDDMLEDVKYESPDMLSKYVDDPSRQKRCIVTSKDGVVTYKKTLRASNDRMERLNDPTIQGPQFEGIPVKRVSELDGLGWTAGNPDYIWLDFEYLCPFFHTTHFFKEKIVPGGLEHPNKNGVYKFSWYNQILRSRRRMGRVYAA